MCFSEIKAEVLFEAELEQARYPQYQDGSTTSQIKLAIGKYTSLLTNRSECCLISIFKFEAYGLCGKTT